LLFIPAKMAFKLTFTYLTGAVLVSGIVSCVTAPAQSEESIRGIEATFGLVAKVERPVFYVCMNTNHPQALPAVRDAVLEWVEPLRVVSSVPLVADVKEGCPGDFQVNFLTAMRAHTFPSQRPVLNLGNPSDYPAVLHEVGHAFGLGDAYVEGVWRCEGAKSESVMCQPGLETISEIDRNGIIKVFRMWHSRPHYAWNGRRFRCPDKMRLYGIGNFVFCAR
jgi:hypothetical protein